MCGDVPRPIPSRPFPSVLVRHRLSLLGLLAATLPRLGLACDSMELGILRVIAWK